MFFSEVVRERGSQNRDSSSGRSLLSGGGDGGLGGGRRDDRGPGGGVDDLGGFGLLATEELLGAPHEQTAEERTAQDRADRGDARGAEHHGTHDATGDATGDDASADGRLRDDHALDRTEREGRDGGGLLARRLVLPLRTERGLLLALQVLGLLAEGVVRDALEARVSQERALHVFVLLLVGGVDGGRRPRVLDDLLVAEEVIPGTLDPIPRDRDDLLQALTRPLDGGLGAGLVLFTLLGAHDRRAVEREGLETVPGGLDRRPGPGDEPRDTQDRPAAPDVQTPDELAAVTPEARLRHLLLELLGVLDPVEGDLPLVAGQVVAVRRLRAVRERDQHRGGEVTHRLLLVLPAAREAVLAVLGVENQVDQEVVVTRPDRRVFLRHAPAAEGGRRGTDPHLVDDATDDGQLEAALLHGLDLLLLARLRLQQAGDLAAHEGHVRQELLVRGVRLDGLDPRLDALDHLVGDLEPLGRDVGRGQLLHPLEAHLGLEALHDETALALGQVADDAVVAERLDVDGELRRLLGRERLERAGHARLRGLGAPLRTGLVPLRVQEGELALRGLLLPILKGLDQPLELEDPGRNVHLFAIHRAGERAHLRDRGGLDEDVHPLDEGVPHVALPLRADERLLLALTGQLDGLGEFAELLGPRQGAELHPHALVRVVQPTADRAEDGALQLRLGVLLLLHLGRLGLGVGGGVGGHGALLLGGGGAHGLLLRGLDRGLPGLLGRLGGRDGGGVADLDPLLALGLGLDMGLGHGVLLLGGAHVLRGLRGRLAGRRGVVAFDDSGGLGGLGLGDAHGLLLLGRLAGRLVGALDDDRGLGRRGGDRLPEVLPLALDGPEGLVQAPTRDVAHDGGDILQEVLLHALPRGLGQPVEFALQRRQRGLALVGLAHLVLLAHVLRGLRGRHGGRLVDDLRPGEPGDRGFLELLLALDLPQEGHRLQLPSEQLGGVQLGLHLVQRQQLLRVLAVEPPPRDVDVAERAVTRLRHEEAGLSHLIAELDVLAQVMQNGVRHALDGVAVGQDIGLGLLRPVLLGQALLVATVAEQEVHVGDVLALQLGELHPALAVTVQLGPVLTLDHDELLVVDDNGAPGLGLGLIRPRLLPLDGIGLGLDGLLDGLDGGVRVGDRVLQRGAGLVDRGHLGGELDAVFEGLLVGVDGLLGDLDSQVLGHEVVRRLREGEADIRVGHVLHLRRELLGHVVPREVLSRLDAERLHDQLEDETRPLLVPVGGEGQRGDLLGHDGLELRHGELLSGDAAGNVSSPRYVAV